MRYTLTIAALCLSTAVWAQPLLPYKNPKLSPAERAADLVSRMSLEEKIGQMTQISTTEINTVENPKNKADRFKPYLSKDKALKFIKEHKVGSFLAAFAVPAKDWYTFEYNLQKLNLENSRLGIPIIYGNDHVHGANYITGATIFPQPFNIANTFNTDFAKEMGRITALEIGDLNQTWNFAPILDIGRNPIWPRQYETFGEDPYVVSKMGATYIKALQEETGIAPYKVCATAKHFVGYSDPKSGWDRAPANIPDQELREFFLPPFKEAIKAGVKTFMINSGEVNGVPVHASEKLLNGILRKELGFDGVILTDWADVLQLIGEHKIAHNEKEATKMALLAGIDMSMTASSVGFCKVTKELVEEGSIPVELIDKSCFRILKLKFDLGLFENPYPSQERFKRIGAPEHKQVALNAARESIVLLKNDGLLPLNKGSIKNIVVTGNAANSKRNVTGAWTIEWGGAPEERFPAEMKTVFTALKDEFNSAAVTWVADSGNKGEAKAAELQSASKNADLIVVAVGEEPYAEGLGNINDLNLPEGQQQVVKRAIATGKPVILVVLAGRPRLITEISKQCKAVFWAGLPGNEGAQALAEIMAGKVNPSGKMAITYPSSSGHITPYNCKVHDRYTNLFPFGHGLSYTEFMYSDLELSDTIINRNQAIKAKVKVSNKGKIAGKEAVLWYIKDEVRTITPPMKELAHFDKQELKAGETKTFEFSIDPTQHLSFPDENGKQLVEQGYFEVQVGGLKKRFFLTTSGKGSEKDEFKQKPYLQIDLTN